MNLFKQINQNAWQCGSFLLAGCAFLGNCAELQAQGTLVVPFGSNKELAPAHQPYQFPYKENYIMLPLTNGTISHDGGRTIIVNKPVKVSKKHTTVISLGHGAPNVSPTPVVPRGFNGGNVPQPSMAPACGHCASPYPVISQPVTAPGAALYVPQNTVSEAVPHSQTFTQDPPAANPSVLEETPAPVPGTAPLPAPVENEFFNGTPSDAGTPYGTGTPSDAGTPYGTGSPSDAGTPYGTGSPSDAGTPYGTGTPSDAGTQYGTGTPSDAGTQYGTETPSDFSTDTRMNGMEWNEPGPTSSQNTHSNSEQSAWRSSGEGRKESDPDVMEMRGSPMVPSRNDEMPARTLEMHSAKPPVASPDTLRAEPQQNGEVQDEREGRVRKWKTIPLKSRRNAPPPQGVNRSSSTAQRNGIPLSGQGAKTPSSEELPQEPTTETPTLPAVERPEIERPIPSQLPDPSDSQQYPGSTLTDDGRTV